MRQTDRQGLRITFLRQNMKARIGKRPPTHCRSFGSLFSLLFIYLFILTKLGYNPQKKKQKQKQKQKGENTLVFTFQDYSQFFFFLKKDYSQFDPYILVAVNLALLFSTYVLFISALMFFGK